MKEIFEQYGPAIIVAFVIIALLGIVIAAFKLPVLTGFLSNLIGDFMTAAGLS